HAAYKCAKLLAEAIGCRSDEAAAIGGDLSDRSVPRLVARAGGPTISSSLVNLFSLSAFAGVDTLSRESQPSTIGSPSRWWWWNVLKNHSRRACGPCQVDRREPKRERGRLPSVIAS